MLLSLQPLLWILSVEFKYHIVVTSQCVNKLLRATTHSWFIYTQTYAQPLELLLKLGTVNLLAKIACFVKKEKIYFFCIKSSWSELVSAKEINHTEPSPSVRLPCQPHKNNLPAINGFFQQKEEKCFFMILFLGAETSRVYHRTLVSRPSGGISGGTIEIYEK